MNNENKQIRVGKTGFSFWSKETLTGVIISVAMALFIILVSGLSTDTFGASDNMAETAGGIFPYYLMFAGCFVLIMLSIGWFQNAFFLLVSANVTRKRAVNGIFLSLISFMAVILGIIALIWSVSPGDIARDGMKLIWLFAGGFLILGALSTALGAVSLKWGKSGLLIMVLVGLIGGAIIGFCTATSNRTIVELMESCIGRNYLPVAVAGILVFLLAYVLVRRVLGKIEVRR